MKKTKKKQRYHNSIFEEKSEVGHFVGNHNTSVQAKKKKSTQEISQLQDSMRYCPWDDLYDPPIDANPGQDSMRYTPWEDSYGPPFYTNPGQDTFEDYPVNPSRRVLNLFLLFKLIYAGIIFSIMVFKSNMSSGDKICGGLFWFMAIAACICMEDSAERLKLKIAKSIYGAKTYLIMGAYAVFTLFYCFLRYCNQMENSDLLVILIMISLSNEVLVFIDCYKLERKNYVKLSGFKYIWMILMPILLILQIYGNLPFNHAIPFILMNFIAIIVEESTSMLFLSGIFPGYYIY